MDMIKRIKQIADNEGITISALEKKIGASKGVLSRALNKGTDIQSKWLSEIVENYPNYNPVWLLTGQGGMTTNKQSEALPVKRNLMRVVSVPIHAHAGFLNGYGDEAYMDELPFEYWEVDKQYKGNYIVFEVKGDSMDDNSVDSILDGDRILCREIMQHHWSNKLHINKWNFVIVHKEEGIIVKRIIDHNTEKGIITCHSLNPYYDDFKVNLKEVIALFNVVDMKRTLRL
jgi:phage repressor protein C with HTH and peptisase S24 domain